MQQFTCIINISHKSTESKYIKSHLCCLLQINSYASIFRAVIGWVLLVIFFTIFSTVNSVVAKIFWCKIFSFMTGELIVHIPLARNFSCEYGHQHYVAYRLQWFLYISNISLLLVMRQKYSDLILPDSLLLMSSTSLNCYMFLKLVHSLISSIQCYFGLLSVCHESTLVCDLHLG